MGNIISTSKKSLISINSTPNEKTLLIPKDVELNIDRNDKEWIYICF